MALLVHFVIRIVDNKPNFVAQEVDMGLKSLNL